MERTSIKELVKWKDSSRRNPRVIEGARQVGKTWLVKEFARQNYKQLAYVNFENMKVLQSVFIQDFDIDRIFSSYIIMCILIVSMKKSNEDTLFV